MGAKRSNKPPHPKRKPKAPKAPPAKKKRGEISVTMELRMDPEEKALLGIWYQKLWKAMEPHVEAWRAEQASADLLSTLVDLGLGSKE